MNNPERLPSETHKPITGYLWGALAVLTCPCHLPILAIVLAGTTAGAFIGEIAEIVGHACGNDHHAASGNFPPLVGHEDFRLALEYEKHFIICLMAVGADTGASGFHPPFGNAVGIGAFLTVGLEHGLHFPQRVTASFAKAQDDGFAHGGFLGVAVLDG